MSEQRLKAKFLQKFSNWEKTVRALEISANDPILKPRDLSGIVKDFEITYELAWKTLKDLLELEGQQTKAAKDVFTQAFKAHYIDNEASWLSMIEDRNLTAHTYDEAFAYELCER